MEENFWGNSGKNIREIQLLFHKISKKAEQDILKYLTNLKTIKDDMLDDGKKKIITKTKDYPQKQAKVKALEREIDRLVYQLYGLTAEEIAIVEENVKK